MGEKSYSERDSLRTNQQVIGARVSDKESDVSDYEKFYGVTVPKYNEYYVPGIKEEAIRYYGPVQGYMNFVKNAIEAESVNVHATVIHNILTTMDCLKYGDQLLMVLKLSSDKPLFYKNELYVRYDSNNELVSSQSDKFYEILGKFTKF